MAPLISTGPIRFSIKAFIRNTTVAESPGAAATGGVAGSNVVTVGCSWKRKGGLASIGVLVGGGICEAVRFFALG